MSSNRSPEANKGSALRLTRRQFVALAGTGLTLGLPPVEAAKEAGAGAARAGLIQPFVRIAPNGEITILIRYPRRH